MDDTPTTHHDDRDADRSPEADESLASATEELVSRVTRGGSLDVEGFIRRFPEAAELLREAAPILLRETEIVPTETFSSTSPDEAGPAGDESLPTVSEGMTTRPRSEDALDRGRAMEICRCFEDDLRRGRGPVIEDRIRADVEPQRSALLLMLLGAELRHRMREGDRPGLEEYRLRFPECPGLIEAAFAGAVGPERIGPFGVLRPLGGGAFGKVYLARDERLDRLVAIKVPRPEQFSGPQDVDRFLQEARLAARIKHPGIVTVYQADRDDAFGCFVVMEYVEGRPLAALLRTERPSPTRAAEMMMRAAEAVSYAHEQGLVHRDLKPGNILVDAQGRPHIADFGLAVHESDRWPRKGEIAGTPPYMAPEQVRGEGHRLDGRTDIWALGVILYRMLTGTRPFDGGSNPELFDDILHREPIPPRQRDRTVPHELERICLKCLSKRMTDRYATAEDLAENLRHWLGSGDREPSGGDMAASATPPEGEKAPAPDALLTSDSAVSTPVRVRPRGLRAFDVDDRDFFLGLLPGPRDRDGLPESLRFWKARIEAGEHDDPFAVGLLCGPSGSGKTSMVRAGLLCRLSPDVIPVYVEASPDTTEARLLGALRRLAPGRADGVGLAEWIAALRGRRPIPAGRKVLIVLDQFEQWLHADHQTEEGEGELVGALRQCDGAHVQCLVLVRDDFAMAAARFMRALEIRLVEGHNFATVDPFDLAHARKVLREFGLAYDRFGEGDTGPQDRFLDQAVAALAEDGEIAPVRLALLAQMIKDKPWTPATLKDLGGPQGIGVTFLEESLAGAAANPEHRLHLPAARRVLQALLPEGGADIKGHMRSYQDLLLASGYARRRRDFDTLLTILDTELRLITPTDPRGPDLDDAEPPAYPSDRYYHLSHDYLVPSLREWLTRKRRETLGGRAAIRLAERTAEWTARRSSRYLPSWWEWLSILMFTRRSRRSPADRRLVGAATRYHATRVAAVAAAIALLSILAADRLGASRARTLLRELDNAESRNVPRVIEDLAPYRSWADRLLRSLIDDAGTDPRRKVRARLALLPVDAAQAGLLISPLLDADPDDFLVIREALRRYGDRPALAQHCRAVLLDEREVTDHRLRAGMALAGLLGDRSAPEDAALSAKADSLADRFVDDLLSHPDRYNDWLEAMRPARALLVPPLEKVFRNAGRSDGARSFAATILANYAGGEPGILTDLLLDANSRQFPVILRALSGSQADIIPVLTRWIRGSPRPGATQGERFASTGRRANAGIALLHWGDPGSLWPLLRHSPDPLLRTYLIDRLPRLSPNPSTFLERLPHEGDVSARRALILILGGIPPDRRTSTWTDRAANRLLALYQGDPDAGIHSTAEWALRRWRQESRLEAATARLAAEKAPVGRSWYVTRTGHTMVTLPGPVTFRMGAGEQEGSSDGDEDVRTRGIPRTFAMATKEVRADQFLALTERYLALKESRRFPNDPSPVWDGPINVVTWLDAVVYCRLLSEAENITEDQMCYPPIEEIKAGMRPIRDHLGRTGYRLPTEAEWEYACRAGAVTSRSFGDDPEMLPRYAWFIGNSNGRTWPGGLLLPNDFGLFDVLGNLKEWCEESYTRIPPDGPDREDPAAVDGDIDRVARGGAYVDQAHVLRGANRYYAKPGSLSFSMGFRVARTCPKSQ